MKIRTYKTIILTVVLYGCETWTLILWEEHRLRVFDNSVLKRIFGLKRDKVTGGWGKLHNEELNNFSSSNIIRMIKYRRTGRAGQIALMDKKRNVYRIFVGKPEGQRPLGRPRCRWKDNVKLDLRETRWSSMD
jgi:hypothetical protein